MASASLVEAMLTPSGLLLRRGVDYVRRVRSLRTVGPRRVIFAFHGASGGAAGMGAALYATEPVFRATVDACDRVAGDLGVPVSKAFSDRSWAASTDPGEARRIEIVHLGVIHLALCDLWSAAGIEPDATLSVSLGEMTACYAAEALTRDETVAVLCAVSQVLEPMRPGFLLSFQTDSRTARDVCLGAPRMLNFLGSRSSQISVAYTTLEDAGENTTYLAARGLTPHCIRTSWSYHTMRSPYNLHELETALDHLRPRRPRIPVFSAVAGRDIAPDAAFDALHWHWMIGHRFWFDEATSAALSDGPAVIVNIATDAGSGPLIRETVADLELDLPIVDSMRRGEETEAWASARATISRLSKRSMGATPQSLLPPTVDLHALDLSAPQVLRDPFPYLDALRRAGPVQYLPRHGWLVVGHAEVREVFEQPELFSSRLMASLGMPPFGADPPEHTADRRMPSQRFCDSQLAELRADARDTAGFLLEARAGAAELDVLRDFAAPLADSAAGKLLRLGGEQIARVRSAIGDAERPLEALLPLVAGGLAEVMPAPGPVDQLLWTVVTTTIKRLVAAAMLLLLDDHALRLTVTADPSVTSALLDETARLHPPEFLIPRLATADATLGGARIRAGAVVQLSIAAANRDPACFENPDQVDLERRASHLAFGVGLHRCPARDLARMVAEAGLSVLLERMPYFSPVQPACALRWIPSAATHGLEQLMIAPGSSPGVDRRRSTRVARRADQDEAPLGMEGRS